jgi:hypothetical protein
MTGVNGLKGWVRTLATALIVALIGISLSAISPSATASTPRLDLKILLIGGESGDPTTQAWISELRREGVPFTLVRPGQGDELPAMADPADPNHGFYNGVILGTTSSSLGDLSSVYAYERAFNVRQVNGYEFPNPAVGLNFQAVVDTPFTAQLTTRGKASFPYLAGPVPMDGGSYIYDAYTATIDDPNFVTSLTTPAGRTIGGFFTHTETDPSIDPKAGVQEAVLTFNYNDQMTQFRLLAPGLIGWVTRGVRLGYDRHYLGNQVDDVFLENSLWSTSLNCTPGETDPADEACPVGTGGDPNAPTTRMTAADVSAVTTWQKKNIKLDLAFNASGASSSDPLTTALLSNKTSFRWTNHTWTHPFLGCQTYRAISAPAQPDLTPDGNGSLPAGQYKYAITAVTPYGETTPSPATAITTDSSGAVAVSWQPVSGAQGYRVYGRTDSRGLLATLSGTRYLDNGSTNPGAAAPTTNTAGSPDRGCATWTPTSTLVSEISKNQAWARTNKLPNFDRSELVTGEHSGLDNPNMPAALQQTGITTLAADASRQFDQYLLGPALTAPRYPSNIYYNVSTWDQLIDEYNTIYLPPAQGGTCKNTSTTTCLSQPATKASILASETKIMLQHVLTNDPRLGYSHQSNLTGDRLILDLLGNVMAEYRRLYLTNAPIITPTLESSAAELARQDAWRKAVNAGVVTASVQDGVVTISTTTGVTVPVTLPTGSTLAGTTTAFGTGYAGERSAWTSVTPTTPLRVQVP